MRKLLSRRRETNSQKSNHIDHLLDSILLNYFTKDTRMTSDTQSFADSRLRYTMTSFKDVAVSHSFIQNNALIANEFVSLLKKPINKTNNF